MNFFFRKLKNFLLELFFPQFCLNCGREESWLCQDCQAILEIESWSFCPVCLKRTLDFKVHKNCCQKTNLTGLFWALSYQNSLVKNLIQKFKYQPFVKELSKPLSYFIISHLFLIEFLPKNNLRDYILIPVPLDKRRLRWRGFNQAEEIARELSKTLEIPLILNLLSKIKRTRPQTELTEKERKESLKGAFLVKNENEVKGKKIFLIDDVYTTGATLEECAKVLKEAGAKEVWAIVVARG